MVTTTQFKTDTDSAITQLKSFLKNAPEEGQMFQLFRVASYTDFFGREKQKKVYYENPLCQTITVKMGSTIFRIVNSKNCIEKVIVAIERRHVNVNPYRNKIGKLEAVGRWPFKISAVKFTYWRDCVAFEDDWVVYKDHMAWLAQSIPWQVERLTRPFNLKRRQSIPIHPVSMGRDFEGQEEIVVMRMRVCQENEFFFVRKLFMQLLTLCSIKASSPAIEYKIINFISGGAVLGVFENDSLKGTLAGYGVKR